MRLEKEGIQSVILQDQDSIKVLDSLERTDQSIQSVEDIIYHKVKTLQDQEHTTGVKILMVLNTLLVIDQRQNYKVIILDLETTTLIITKQSQEQELLHLEPAKEMDYKMHKILLDLELTAVLIEKTVQPIILVLVLELTKLQTDQDQAHMILN